MAGQAPEQSQRRGGEVRRSIWFSDPDFGITSDYEGHRAQSEIGSTLSEGKVFAEAAPGKGRFDNLRFDDGGRLWAAAMGDGVHCYDPDGTLIGRLDG